MQMPLLHRRLAAFVGLSLLLLLASGFIPNGPADNAVKLATPLPELPSDLQTGGIHVNSGLPEPVLADQELPARALHQSGHRRQRGDIFR